MGSDPEVSELIHRLPSILLIVFLFGGWVITSVVRSIADNWSKVRQSEQSSALKQSMIERGLSADDIVRILNAGQPRSGTPYRSSCDA